MEQIRSVRTRYDPDTRNSVPVAIQLFDNLPLRALKALPNVIQVDFAHVYTINATGWKGLRRSIEFAAKTGRPSATG